MILKKQSEDTFLFFPLLVLQASILILGLAPVLAQPLFLHPICHLLKDLLYIYPFYFTSFSLLDYSCHTCAWFHFTSFQKSHVPVSCHSVSLFLFIEILLERVFCIFSSSTSLVSLCCVFFLFLLELTLVRPLFPPYHSYQGPEIVTVTIPGVFSQSLSS